MKIHTKHFNDHQKEKKKHQAEKKPNPLPLKNFMILCKSFTASAKLKRSLQ